MRAYYEEPGITIYCGDCRDVLPTLPKVDLVLTDPPYGVGFAKYLSHDDDPARYREMIWPIVQQAEAKVIDGWFCMFQSEHTVRCWTEWFPREWRLIALPKVFGQIGREQISRMTDYALYWKIGTPMFPLANRSDLVFRNWFISSGVVPHGNRPDHPCPRPLDTMRYLLKGFAQNDALILDPFMGSGTTLVAAKQLGRRAIGIEIERKYCDIAIERLRQDVLPLEAAAPETAEQLVLI